MGVYCSETWVNATAGHGIGESGVYETFCETPGELFRASRAEYGRCASSVYVGGADGPPRRIGWVFVGRDHYQDTGEPYLRETWVTVHEAPDTVTRTPHYVELAAA